MQLLYSSTLMISFMFISANHPLSMGLILLIQVSIVSMITGIMALNYWFSYILFMIMVGGMLVLFIYMTSIAANEKFKISKLMMSSMAIMMISMPSTLVIDQMFSYIMISNQELILNSAKFQIYPLIKYFNFPSNLIMLTLIIYLLISLIAVIKITDINYGPLRQK
uniref:NADH-ubiquinone oxidoreductase chain 6 n=1 Tax=Elateroidea sp. 9 KM-2017 TaxID=2219432 RepID=A0A346RJ41_9COLE|nr:NADH dehydrogenase subunit 6 [Elateroidea sp. 9 KM-2017]